MAKLRSGLLKGIIENWYYNPLMPVGNKRSYVPPGIKGINFECFPIFEKTSPSHPDPGGTERINLNFYFSHFFWVNLLRHHKEV